MLEFTNDSEWQRERAQKWKTVEEEIKEGLTRKRVNEFKAVYMTGLIPEGVKINVDAALCYFPDHSIEGVQYCLKVNFSDGLSDHEFVEVQAVLSVGLNRMKDLSRDDMVMLFRYVMGNVFDPGRKFPFYIGQEQELRTITIKPGRILRSMLVTLVHWIKSYKNCESYPFLAEFPEFVVSLIRYANPKMFTFRAAIGRENRKIVQHSAETTIEYTWRLLRYCISPPPAVDASTESLRRKRFLEKFRKEFEKLDEYPGELDKIWREIQIQEGVIKAGPAENIWRKLARKGVPNG